jgi:hypothetical protein
MAKMKKPCGKTATGKTISGAIKIIKDKNTLSAIMSERDGLAAIDFIKYAMAASYPSFLKFIDEMNKRWISTALTSPAVLISALKKYKPKSTEEIGVKAILLAMAEAKRISDITKALKLKPVKRIKP